MESTTGKTTIGCVKYRDDRMVDTFKVMAIEKRYMQTYSL